MKKKRNYNPNLIKAKGTYSLKELAGVCNRHPRTIQIWRKEGLKEFGKERNSFIFIGGEIKRFLKEKDKKQKYPLQLDEFFCPKCHKQRKSLPELLTFEITDTKLGKTAKRAFIRGICETCGQSLLLFSSDRKIQELKERGLILLEHKKTISGSRDSSLNTDIERGEQCLNQTSKMN